MKADLTIRFNPLTETFKTLQISHQNRAVFLATLAISWFWFLGAAYLTQLPNYTRLTINGDETIVTLLLALFSIGIAIGSMLCDRLSGHKIELGLVPLGSIGLTVFGADIFFFTPIENETYSFLTFIAHSEHIRIIIDFLLIGVFGGLYIVPLYAMVQERADETLRSRSIAAINIMNALFMVVSAIFAVLCLQVMSLDIPTFFLILAIMNAAVAWYIYSVIPEFFMRFLIWLITHSLYRIKHIGLDNIPEKGPAVIACNHVSYLDALIIAGACRRPIRFVMHKPIFDLPVLKFIFKTAKAIPIDSKSASPKTYQRAFELIESELDKGEVVCIFPEGKLTTTGEIDTFKNGIEKIIAKTPVPVIPMALRGLWGSYFSCHKGKALTGAPKHLPPKIAIVAGEAIEPNSLNAQVLEEKIRKLRGGRR